MEAGGLERNDTRHLAALDLDDQNIPRIVVVAFWKTVELRRSRIPGPCVYLLRSMPVTEGDVIVFTIGQSVQIELVGRIFPSLVVRAACEGMGAPVGQNDAWFGRVQPFESLRGTKP